MTLRVKLELFAGLIVVVLLVIGAHEWIAEREARIKAEAVVTAQAQVQQQVAQQITALQKQMADQDAAYQAQVKTLAGKFANAVTPAQLAQLSSQLMGLRVPVQVLTPTPTADNPHPSPVAEIPQVDFPQAKAYIQDCEQCKLDRTKLTADAATRQQEAVLAQKQIDSLKTENSALQVAVKGGTVWQRVGKAAKYLLIGGAIGFIAAKH
jgi:FtsZ-binding cell division protein ZapB